MVIQRSNNNHPHRVPKFRRQGLQSRSRVAPVTRSASLGGGAVRQPIEDEAEKEQNRKLRRPAQPISSPARKVHHRHRVDREKGYARRHKMDDEETTSVKGGKWPKPHTRILINLLVDQVTRGKMKNGQFGKNAWKQITSDLVARANHSYSTFQVKGKFNRLRTQHREFSTLLREPSGFGWDPETNTVTASEEAWLKHLDKHPKAKMFQQRGLENYNLLGLVFNKSTATGALAHGSSEAPGDTDDEDAAIELMDAGIHVDIAAGVGRHEEMEDCETNEGARETNSGIQSGATRQHSGKRSSGRKKKPSKATVMNDTFLAMTEVCKVRTQQINSKMESSYPSCEASSRPPTNLNERLPSVRECIEICKQYATPQTHAAKFVVAAQAFQQDGWREAFMSLPEESRKVWLDEL